jgi:hypothetical protein
MLPATTQRASQPRRIQHLYSGNLMPDCIQFSALLSLDINRRPNDVCFAPLNGVCFASVNSHWSFREVSSSNIRLSSRVAWSVFAAPYLMSSSVVCTKGIFVLGSWSSCLRRYAMKWSQSDALSYISLGSAPDARIIATSSVWRELNMGIRSPPTQSKIQKRSTNRSSPGFRFERCYSM